MSIFNKLWDKLKSLKNIFNFKLANEEIIYKNDTFQKYLESIDILDPFYDSVKEAIELCQQSIYFTERKGFLTFRLNELSLKSNDLTIFNNLEKSDLQKLQTYIDAYKTVTKEEGALKTQINNYDKSLDYMAKFEKEIESALKEIEYYEQRQAGLKRDIAYISGEREELIYNKGVLESGIDFLYKFSIVLICVLALTTFTLGVIKTAYEIEIFVPLAVLVVLCIILGSGVYIFQRKFRYELKRNILLQGRAIELLNRSKVLYVNCTSFLSYEYKKFRVRNSEMLRNNWEEYLYQKQVSRRHIAMSNRMKELNDNVIKSLSSKGIENPEILFDELLNLISLEDKKILYKDINDEMANLKKELAELNLKSEQNWNRLKELQSKDITEDKIISKVIESYEDELKNVKD